MATLIPKIFSAWQLVVKRSLAHWKVLLSVVTGVILACAIMSGTVVYYDALRDLALNQMLNEYSDQELDILITGDRGPTTSREHDLLFDEVDGDINKRLGGLINKQIHAGKTPTMFLTQRGREADAGKYNSRSYFAFVNSLEDYIDILPGGYLPRHNVLSANGETLEIEALVQRDVAIMFGLDVGDSLSAIPFWSDKTPVITVVISGIFDKKDFDDDVWYLENKVLDAATGKSFRTAAFYISENAYLNVLGPSFNRLVTNYAWLLDVDTDRINARNARSVLFGIEQLKADLATVTVGSREKTSLDRVLRQFDRKLFFTKLPMFVVMIFMAIVILYYVVTLSALSIEERRGEVALLRSRGARPIQILTVFGLEGITIVGLAIVVGPLLAGLIISFLGFTPAFSDLTGGARLEVIVSLPAYLLGLAGGILSFVAMIIPAVQASRVSVTQQRTNASRPGNSSFFQKYYLDVFLLIISIYLFHQLSQQGSIIAKDLVGELAINQMLLAIPALILIAAAMMILRLFPLVLNWLSKGLSSVLPPGLLLAIWNMSRNPTHYSRLVLLLILTAGLGIFASSFGATLEKSFEERVLYSTGSDIRVYGVKPRYRTSWDFRQGYRSPSRVRANKASLVKSYENVQGVDIASPLLRETGIDLTKGFGHRYEMIAVDPETINQVAWFRDDFAEDKTSDMIDNLKVETQPQGIVMPPDTYVIGARIKANRPHPSVRVTARLLNAQGQYTTYNLGTLNSSQWEDFEVSLRFGERQSIQLSRPLTLVALRIEETGDRRLQAGSILIDEIWAVEAWGKTVLEDFNDISDWSLIRSAPDADADVFRNVGGPDSDSGLALFSWTEGSSRTARGIFHGSSINSLPVLASSAFINNGGRKPGDVFDVSVGAFRVSVELISEINYFPTKMSLNDKYLIVDLKSLINYANLSAYTKELVPNEIWISSKTEDNKRSELVEVLGKVRNADSDIIFDRSVHLNEVQIDPLVQAGWRALLLLSFVAVLLLSCLGFAIHIYVSFRNRQLQFALLRTIGITGTQMLSMVWIEQLLVVAAGMALGTWMGGRLGSLIMPFLGHDDWGGRVIPPFVMQVDWSILIVTYGIMLLLFSCITVGMILLIHKIVVHKILRLGEQ